MRTSRGDLESSPCHRLATHISHVFPLGVYLGRKLDRLPGLASAGHDRHRLGEGRHGIDGRSRHASGYPGIVIGHHAWKSVASCQ
jgi:hypothetical protein